MTDSFQYRALFLSDIHLGTRGCQAEMLLDFLREYDAEYIYLVGDIFDGWRLRKGWYWPQSHNDVVQKILRKGRKGSKIIYVPGNHDEVMRNYLGTHFGGIDVKEKDIYTALSGEKFLIIHGDQFDMVVMNAKWLAYLGDWAYETILKINTSVNRIKRLWGGQYWSLSRWAKHKVKSAVNFIGDYEAVLSSEAEKADVNGIICGHIHHPAMHDVNGIKYINTGDWVESCTAVIEHLDGTFELIEWSKVTRLRTEARSSKKMQLVAGGRQTKTV
ncbi:UDP-2,3-diacylglucosamine diphosphatase [Lentilitoribacter sp. Alg239-R112]|jgi:UDP-2,3-diacylglucosamine pyrophosphatase LpxH|uniref:UDP-2,3-diacylglucosamine diphosphatase n=1 Tax=Lentilitoribacter sp. Alg239-R112 TaxID=2305987 RepID=UPI0013A6BA66|nr:UDP-2,3-diacylglucosamine diphosphatase [Lentilitoribacter sp. Alg239-R112]